MMLTVAAIAVVVFMAIAPSIICRFPHEQRGRIGVYVLIPLQFLFVGVIFLVARWW
jgi:hypothetical protein